MVILCNWHIKEIKLFIILKWLSTCIVFGAMLEAEGATRLYDAWNLSSKNLPSN